MTAGCRRVLPVRQRRLRVHPLRWPRKRPPRGERGASVVQQVMVLHGRSGACQGMGVGGMSMGVSVVGGSGAQLVVGRVQLVVAGQQRQWVLAEM